MRPFGGYFELEVGRAGKPYHAGRLALCSGRACFGRILDEIRPRRVHVPFYVCDAVTVPLRGRGIAISTYALTECLDPAAPIDLAEDEAVVTVNYFGLKNASMRKHAQRDRGRAIIDDTQAFFARGYPGAWSFNSARKFFGVADGGYAIGPGLVSEDRPRLDHPHIDHLVARLQGDVSGGYASYLEAEAAVTDAPLGMSHLSERLLAAVDYDEVAAVRRRNYQRVHERFGANNRLPAALLTLGSQVPYCYPLLPDRPAPARESFWKAGLYVPVLWPELERRPEAGVDWERRLAAELLPLPIDQRYGEADIDQLCRRVQEVCGW